MGPLNYPAELADGPTLYVRCQGQGICFVSSTNQIQLSLYTRLAPGLTKISPARNYQMASRNTAYSNDIPVVSPPEWHLVWHEDGKPTCSKIGTTSPPPFGWNTTRVFTVPGNRTWPREAASGPQSRHQYLLPPYPTCWVLGAIATISNDLSRLSPAHIF